MKNIIIICIIGVIIIGYLYERNKEDKTEHIVNIGPYKDTYYDDEDPDKMNPDSCNFVQKDIPYGAYRCPGYHYPLLGSCPWWNSTRFTRNMSYDLRGDEVPYPYYVGPWWVSPRI